MNDRSWLLNPTAITAAKRCIQAVEQELGVKLKLSHPQFMEMLNEYCLLTESSELENAFLELAQLCDQPITNLEQSSSTVVEMPRQKTPAPAVEEKASTPPPAEPQTTSKITTEQEELVEYRGKYYPKFNESGGVFKGLYRGQARYA